MECQGLYPWTASTTPVLRSPSTWSIHIFRIPCWHSCTKTKRQKHLLSSLSFIVGQVPTKCYTDRQGAKSSFWHRTYKPSCGWRKKSIMIPAWNWVKIMSPSLILLATSWQPSSGEQIMKGFNLKTVSAVTPLMAPQHVTTIRHDVTNLFVLLWGMTE